MELQINQEKLDRFLRSREGRRLVAKTKCRQKEEAEFAHQKFRQMMGSGCHDCRRNATHAMRTWDDDATPGRMVAVCSECAEKRVTASIVNGIKEDRPYEPDGVFSVHAVGRCARCYGSGTVRWGKWGDWDSAFGCYPCPCQGKPESTRRIGKRSAPADPSSETAD